VRRALAKAREGDAPLALTHLALAGVGRLTDPRDDARRLFIADGLMKAGVLPRTILEALGGDPPAQGDLARAYNPDQPRVPAGSGRESGQWTSGDFDDDAPAASPPSPHGVQVADNSPNWAQYLSPVGTAEAAERTGAPFNGVGPNKQHDRAVAESMANFEAMGLIVVAIGNAARVTIPGFATPRIYDFIALDPDSGELVGVEVKSTKFDAIFLNPFQVEKDVAIYALGGVKVDSLDAFLTSVAYDTACDGCENIRVRTIYLHARLLNAGIPFYTRHYIGSEQQ
jgi:hypothetical protein